PLKEPTKIGSRVPLNGGRSNKCRRDASAHPRHGWLQRPMPAKTTRRWRGDFRLRQHRPESFSMATRDEPHIGATVQVDPARLSEEAFLRDFAGNLPEANAKVLYAVQEPFRKELLAGKTSNAAWRSKPSFYAVSADDRTINPYLQ